MTAPTDLTALRNQLQNKVDANKRLSLDGSTTGVAALDAFFAARALTLSDPKLELTDAPWPRKLTLTGGAATTWTLIGLGGDAVSTQATLTFTQAAQNGEIAGTFVTDGKVTAGQTAIALTGTLGDKNALVFRLPSPPTKLPLPAVGNFAFANSFGGYLPPDLPLFAEMPFTQIQVTARYGGQSATCAVTTGVAGNWPIVEGRPSLTGVFLTLSSTTTAKQGQRVTSLAAALGASLKIGGQPWTVTVTLSGGSQVDIVIASQADKQPALAAIAGLIAGDAAAQAVQEAVQKLPLANLQLNRIEIAFDWKERKLLSAGVAATLPFTFNKAKANFDLSVAVPPLSLGGGLSPATPVKIRDVIIEYLGDAAGFPDTVVTELAFTAEPSDGSFGFSLAMADVFTAGPMSLDTVTVAIAKSAAGVKGEMAATLTIGGIGVLVQAAYDQGWRISGRTAYGQVIHIGELIDEGLKRFNVTVPDALRKFELHDLSVTIDTAKPSFTFGCAGSFPIADKTLPFTVAIDLNKETGEWKGSFIGSFEIGAASFKVTFKDEPGVKYLRAELKPTSGKLGMAEIAQTFGIDLSDVPAELLPVLTGATFTYDFDKSQLVLTASTEKVAVTVVSVPNKQGRLYAAVVKIAVKADISQLPVVGTHLAEIEDIGLDGMSLVIASDVFKDEQITTVNGVIPDGQPKVPALSASGRVVLSADLTLGGQPAKPLQLAFAKPDTRKANEVRPVAMAVADPAPSTPVPSGRSSGQGKWINIQKSIGPITLNRAAVAYRDKLVWLMLDAGFAMGPVEIDLMGAAIGFKPELPPTPAGASLDGLFVGFDSGAVSISGGLLKYTPETGPVEYDGQLSLKVPQFQISAMGSYASLPQGPSLFAYAVLVAPIGGPPFLQIDAVSAGFGFNRNLRIPGLDKLPEMPLIAAVREGGGAPFSGKNAAQALEVMHDYVQPHYGEYFLAAGVRVASCQLIKGFLLATVKLGTEFEVALLGLATLSVPPSAPSPIGFAELVMMADVNFTRGTLFIGAQLTAASYILAKNCRLTGGFAVAVWFKDDPDNALGYKAGDFLVTLGGYHPAFTKPSWYPDVPRLGFNWTVTPQLTIKGGMYFALVPSAVMAGGSLEAVWESGDLRAWFSAWMDFLLGWKPFHYEASIGVSLGASYKANIGVTSFTITIHVGVDIKLWGPEFGGTATADLYVISITIGFGNKDKPKVKPIGWDDFKASFLPDTKPKPHLAMAAAAVGDAPVPISTNTVCLTKVANGLVRDLAGAGGVDWVLDPERFQLTTWSAVPSKGASYTGSRAAQTVPAVNTNFGIGPSDVSAANFVSTHTVVIAKRQGQMAADDIRVDVQPVLETLPAAIWSTDAALDPSLAKLNNAPARTIPNALTGLSIAAKADNPRVTPLPVSLDSLRHEDDQQSRSVVWAAPDVPKATGYAGRPPMPDFTAGLVAADKSRSLILAVLAQQNVPVATSVNVSQLAASAPSILLAPPVLSVLGAEPTQQAA